MKTLQLPLFRYNSETLKTTALLLGEHLRNLRHMRVSRGGFIAPGVLKRLQRIMDVQCGQTDACEEEHAN